MPCALYCCGYSVKHDFLVVGGNCFMFVMQLKRDESRLERMYVFKEHTDFVSQVVCTPNGRIFSCGYDGRICAYESNIEEKLVVMTAPAGRARASARCHDGAIACAAFNPEPAAQTLITGGFDMTVKVWNHDALTAHAQFLPSHTFSLPAAATALCYLPATRALWVTAAAGGPPGGGPIIYDPRTGTNLTDFVPPPAGSDPRAAPGDRLARVVADGREAVGLSEARALCVWRYNPWACVSVVVGHTDWVEAVARVPDASLEIGRAHV